MHAAPAASPPAPTNIPDFTAADSLRVSDDVGYVLARVAQTNCDIFDGCDRMMNDRHPPHHEALTPYTPSSLPLSLLPTPAVAVVIDHTHTSAELRGGGGRL